ncbi:glycerate kinase [Kutzneria sp. 744]|nr:glycerate kinase [Kutzneria sp. 744]
MTAREAAEAIATGWRRTAPADELLLRPLADGGPGFVEVLHGALGGDIHEARVTGPLGQTVTARWLAHDGTAYIESAQACGLHLTDRRDPETSTTYGVGELIAAARAAGMTTAVVGLGGSGTTDGGAGMIRALGGHVTDDTGSPIGPGGADLRRAVDVLLPDAGIALVAASDVGISPARTARRRPHFRPAEGRRRARRRTPGGRPGAVGGRAQGHRPGRS